MIQFYPRNRPQDAIECTIEYTKGDTFNLVVQPDNALDEGSQLHFVVTKADTYDSVIDKTYSMRSDGTFMILLDSEDKAALLKGDYVYKMTVITATGIVDTQLSGDFIVKWGA